MRDKLRAAFESSWRRHREAYEYLARSDRLALRHRGYAGRITGFDDGAFHGRVEIDRDVVTFQADRQHDTEETIAAIRREFALSVDDYLAWCEEDGVEPMPPKESA